MYNNKNYVYNLKQCVVFTMYILLNELRKREKEKICSSGISENGG